MKTNALLADSLVEDELKDPEELPKSKGNPTTAIHSWNFFKFVHIFFIFK